MKEIKRYHMPLPRPLTACGGCFYLLLVTVFVFICTSAYSNAFETLFKLAYESPVIWTNTSTVFEADHTGPLTDVSRNHTFVVDHNRKDEALKKRFPECIIIGAKKGGTRAVGEYLNMHPNVAVVFEPHFFSLDSNYRRGLEYYRRQMPKTYPYQMTIEKTPRYFISELAPKRIYKFNKAIKLIVTLRHPVKRMISDYWHARRSLKKGTINKYNESITYGSVSFEELAIDNRTGEINMDYQPLKVSMYYLHLTCWLEYFPKEQIHIVDGDNLIVNPFEEVEKMEKFLGLKQRLKKDMFYYNTSKGFYCMLKSDKHKCLSHGKGHSHPDIDPTVYGKLMDFFKPLNGQLFSLLKRRFDWN